MELSLLNLLLVLLAAWVAGSAVARMGYPAIFGELLAGIVLGPPLLGLLESSDTLAILAELGVLLMMLYIGMEIDAKELFKASWGGFLAAIGGFVTPFALAYLVVVYMFGGTVMGRPVRRYCGGGHIPGHQIQDSGRLKSAGYPNSPRHDGRRAGGGHAFAYRLCRDYQCG